MSLTTENKHKAIHGKKSHNALLCFISMTHVKWELALAIAVAVVLSHFREEKQKSILE